MRSLRPGADLRACLFLFKDARLAFNLCGRYSLYVPILGG